MKLVKKKEALEPRLSEWMASVSQPQWRPEKPPDGFWKSESLDDEALIIP